MVLAYIERRYGLRARRVAQDIIFAAGLIAIALFVWTIITLGASIQANKDTLTEVKRLEAQVARQTGRNCILIGVVIRLQVSEIHKGHPAATDGALEAANRLIKAGCRP